MSILSKLEMNAFLSEGVQNENHIYLKEDDRNMFKILLRLYTLPRQSLAIYRITEFMYLYVFCRQSFVCTCSKKLVVDLP